ncbi:MAG TPA: hypothetical protein DEB39_09255 [Planctomycetaceae bacterium]|nr:hypothetical protein [Planctomycetaceae bacterium]
MLDDALVTYGGERKIAAPSENTTAKTNKSRAQRKRKKGKLFNFYERGLKNGDKIKFVADPKIVAVVCGERTVKFEGNEWTTSGLTKELFRRQNAVRNSGAYQGPLHFTFNGVRLTDLPEK